ncbi:MAG: DUF1269 domain-containing protein [Acidimicrobiales bacterium]
MSNLTVLSFDSATGAQELSDVLWDAAIDGLIDIEDMAIVRRNPEGPPKMWQVVQTDDDTKRNAFTGAFWGLALGTLFVMPVAGAVGGLAVGLTSGHGKDFGIDDDFIEAVRDRLEPNTSAMFLLGEASDPQALRDRIPEISFEIASTTLDAEREAELREMFSAD